MKLDRLQPEAFAAGSSLTVVETKETGTAALVLSLPSESLLFQYKANATFVFRNQKRADGIVLQPTDSGWQALLVELKRTVRPKSWGIIKLQWVGAWHHALALAGVLEVNLTPKAELMVGYQRAVMGRATTDPILLKMTIDPVVAKDQHEALVAYEEWETGQARLDDLGCLAFIKVALDDGGNGHWSPERASLA